MRKRTTFCKAWGIALIASLLSVVTATAAVKVHTIGDSTMANYDENSTDKRGWCQMLQQFFNADEVVINNRGKSGASSKSFYLEAAYWKTVIANVNEGDYVVIQFAHNDEKNGGLDGDEVIAHAKENGQSTADIDKISLFVAGAGGSGMRCKIYYATDAEFSNATLIQELSTMAGNTVYAVESIPVVNITNGESIYLRIYPWYKSEATGKTICLSDVYIHGMASDATGIEEVTATNGTSDELYDLMGHPVKSPVKGHIYLAKGKKLIAK